MVNSEYSTDNYKLLKISVGSIIKNSKMVRFVPDHLKTEKRCKNIVKKLPFEIRYFSDQYKTQEMWDKFILENGGTLKSVPDCYKIKKNILKLLIIVHMLQDSKNM